MSAAVASARRWVRACSIHEIPERGGRLVTIDRIEIGVFRTSHGAVLAVVNRCPHKGGPLSEGIVTEHRVVCPMHGWTIDLVTGSAVAPDRGCVTRFPVDVRGDDVYLEVSQRPREMVPIEDVTGTHPDTGRARLGRRRAQAPDFTTMDFDRDVPVLAVEPPSPETAETLRLEVTRETSSIATLTIEDLRRRYAVRDVPTYVTCLMFGFTRPVTWSGVRLSDVVEDLAGAEGPTPFFSFYSWDTIENQERERFWETLPLHHAMDPRTMLVFGMNGGPLPKEHGGPLRLVAPFLQGYKSVKWLTWIKLTGEDEVGFKKKHGFIEFPELEMPLHRPLPGGRRGPRRER